MSRCALCNRHLVNTFTVYAEGLFCDDAAGCRRTAASTLIPAYEETILELNAKVADLQRTLFYYERVDEPEGDPPEPAEGHGLGPNEERP